MRSAPRCDEERWRRMAACEGPSGKNRASCRPFGRREFRSSSHVSFGEILASDSLRPKAPQDTQAASNSMAGRSIYMDAWEDEASIVRVRCCGNSVVLVVALAIGMTVCCAQAILYTLLTQ